MRPFGYDLTQIPYDYTVRVMNGFKGLDLIDRVPEELCMEVRNTVQEAVTKIIPKKKKCKKAKWLSEETLQIAEERREAKGKRERKRYTQLNAEFQGITRSNKKVFLSILTILRNSAFSGVLSFPSSLFTSLLSSAICKVSADNHFAFLHFFFFGMVLFTISCTIVQTEVLQAQSARSNPLNLFITSTV